MAKGVRADIWLVEAGLVDSRQRAQALIMAGQVYCQETRINKSSEMIHERALTIRGEAIPFVSRGGLKLDHALKHFSLTVNGLVCADVGASTGGFCDVLLQNGAKKIYAIDVGYGQLHEKIRGDGRVVVMEQQNARLLTPDQFAEPLGIIVCDASFISLQKVLIPIVDFLIAGGALVALIKPQFQVGAKFLKKGIVTNESARQEAIEEAASWVKAQGFTVQGITPSPITGAKGNVEYLIYAIKS